MPRLYGSFLTRADLLQRVGDLSQIAGVRVGELGDGLERGVRIAEVHTGSGLQFTVLVDRGMDIGAASFCGAPLAWRSPTTTVAPAFFEPEGLGWLRGFGGGLVTTCGLTYFGAPGIDQGQNLGLHGRASFLPAAHLAYGGDWNGDEYDLWVTGELREASVLGENLALRRRISARLGESRFLIDDTVVNEGYDSTPHMLLYHVTVGFPIVSEQSEWLASVRETRPRDASAAAGLEHYAHFQPPTAGYREQVFYHTPRADAAGMAQVAVVNRTLNDGQGLGIYLRFRPDELPYLVQWKMMGQGTYACGLEPATNPVEGRAKERAEGRLISLRAGESRHYRLEVGVLTSRAEIEAFAAALP
jgi:hypothetical protein